MLNRTEVHAEGTRAAGDGNRRSGSASIDAAGRGRLPVSGGAARRLAAVAVLACLPQALPAAIEFEDVTEGSGLEYVGESYGASWGDYNSDGLPDAFVSHHRQRPGLYVNLGDGTFGDRAGPVLHWKQFPTADQHGGAWADFDGDGDSDLFVSTGARDDEQFFVHNGSVLVYSTPNYSFAPLSRAWEGRQPVWFDFSGDGLLDFSIAVQHGKPHLYEQTGSDFLQVNNAYGNNCLNNDYTQLADITRSGKLDWICAQQSLFPQRIYDITQVPFADETSLMPQTVNVVDTLFASLDGDLFSDAVVVRGRTRVSGAEVVGPNAIEAHLITDLGGQKGITFQSAGDVTIVLEWSARNTANVFIGATGTHPPKPETGQPITFTLSPGDPNVHGLMPLDSNPGKASIFVGYDPGTQTWTLWNVAGAWSYLYAFLDSTQPVNNLSQLGLQALDGPFPPLLLYTSPGSHVDRTSFAGLNPPLPCVSVAAADFDNDMDVDLYFVCRNAVSNVANRLYENDGSGVFTVVSNAGGAQGPVGPGVGLGENVTTADYDVDGFVDLLVNNGLALWPEPPRTHGGPDKLYRNVGNGNHWIELDLVGVASNRDAVGARVTATAGGVAQLREQNGGYHRWAQNHDRIHFGLGSNPVVDLQIEWPSGAFDTLNDVAADNLYRITEGGTIEEVVLPTDVNPPTCGLPSYDKATEQAVFIGKDCATGTWQVRMTAGGGNVKFEGDVISDQPFSSVTGFSIESSDTFQSTPAQITYGLIVGGAGQDGFDFSFPDGANVCFDVAAPSGATVLLGTARTSMSAPFNLQDFGPCSDLPPTLSIDDVTVAEGDGSATFTVSLSSASSDTVTVDFASADVSAVSPDDYGAVSGTLTFSPGQTVKTVPVTIVNDAVSEGTETFEVGLSSAANATVGASPGTGTIADDEVSSCGLPAYDKATELGVFIGRDCATDTWQVRVTGGGSATSISYQGTVISAQPLSNVAGFSVEASDTFEFTSTQITYGLNVAGAGQDGFNFQFPAGTSVCFGLDAPSGATVLVGTARTPVTVPFDMETLGSCSNVLPSLSIDDVTVAEGDGSATFTVSLSATSSDTVTVDYASVDMTAVSPGDYASVSGTLTFDPGQTVKTVPVNIVNDALSEGTETFEVSLSNEANASLAKATGTGTIADDEVSSCGLPSYNKATEQGMFIGRDCATDIWQVRVTGGGGSQVSFEGNVVSDQPFSSVSSFRMEGADTLGSPTPEEITYLMSVGNTGQDGFDFQFPAGADTCFDVAAPVDAMVLVGTARTPVTVPFDLETLGACTN